MARAPQQQLAGWVARFRPYGCPEMTWGRALKKALKCNLEASGKLQGMVCLP